MRIRRRFTIFLLLLLPLMLALGATAIVAADRMDAASTRVHERALTDDAVTNLARELDQAAQLSLRLVPANDLALQRRLNARLETRVMPEIDRMLGGMQRIYADGTPAERVELVRLTVGWRGFRRLHASERLEAVGEGPAYVRLNERLGRDIGAIFDGLSAATGALGRAETAKADRAREQAEAVFRRSLAATVALTLATLIVAAGGG